MAAGVVSRGVAALEGGKSPHPAGDWEESGAGPSACCHGHVGADDEN